MTENVNIPLLRKAVEWAEAEAAKPKAESRWRQQYWVTPAADDQSRAEWGMCAHENSAESFGHTCGTCYCIAGYVTETQIGPTENVPTEARELLGLTKSQTDDLFRASNTIEDVRRIAEEIAGERL